MSFCACTEMSDTKFVTTRAKQRCGETPGQGQKNDIQADRQNTHEKDSVDVLYRNEQEILAMMQEIRENPRDFCFVA